MGKLVKIISKSGVMTVVDGVHVGKGQNSEIGGVDNPIVKNEFTHEPYIPGSSLKGKMRFGAEVAKGMTDVCRCGKKECMICTLFGSLNKDGNCGPGRLIVYDMELTEEFKNKESVVAIRNSTAIDRATGTAKNKSLRQFEVIEKGTQLNYRIDIKVYEGDNEEKLIKFVDKALETVEKTGLGGKISTGCGHVTFEPSKTDNYSEKFWVD